MKPEEAERLLAAADKGFQVAGFASFEDAVNHVYKFYENLLQLLSKARTREATKAALIEGDKISADEFSRLLSFLPNVVYAIRKSMPEVTKQIPHSPGGRPEAFSDAEKRQVCDQISSLHRHGVSMGMAIERVAMKHGKSERTIRRVWRERARLGF
jgi:hypothetical protein